MSIRERTWITKKGEVKKAMVADFIDKSGRRVLQTLNGERGLKGQGLICPCCNQFIKNRKETKNVSR